MKHRIPMYVKYLDLPNPTPDPPTEGRPPKKTEEVNWWHKGPEGDEGKTGFRRTRNGRKEWLVYIRCKERNVLVPRTWLFRDPRTRGKKGRTQKTWRAVETRGGVTQTLDPSKSGVSAPCTVSSEEKEEGRLLEVHRFADEGPRPTEGTDRQCVVPESKIHEESHDSEQKQKWSP